MIWIGEVGGELVKALYSVIIPPSFFASFYHSDRSPTREPARSILHGPHNFTTQMLPHPLYSGTTVWSPQKPHEGEHITELSAMRFANALEVLLLIVIRVNTSLGLRIYCRPAAWKIVN